MVVALLKSHHLWSPCAGSVNFHRSEKIRTADQICLLTLLLLPALIFPQSFGNGISSFLVREKNSLNIGFASFDLYARLTEKENITLDYGMRFIGAAAGRRGGYFAFGYFSELALRKGKFLQPGVNIALLAGGGAAAPDHDGWMLQGTLFAKHQFKKGLTVKAGINYALVSGGDIAGWSPLVGVQWKMRTAGSPDSLTGLKFAWSAAYGEAGVAYYNSSAIGLIGAGAHYFCGRRLAGDFVIHAITNAHGGYMQTLVSGGPDVSIGPFHVSPALVLGLGGGGGVRTVGGGLYGGQLGLCISGQRFYAGLKLQAVRAFSNRFYYDGVLLSIGKKFAGDEDPRLDWELLAKAYLGAEGFGNIGARLTAFEYRKFRIAGSTFWALTHDRGAYAEGLFEAMLGAPAPTPLYLVASLGVGAGSGINQRKAALICSGGAGFASPWSNFPLSVECAYWTGGNIPHWALAIGWRVRS